MKKFYITTSIAYTNAPPHIGFALESIQADVLARYHRSLKEDVFFLTGTDEHGAKIVKAAEAAGKTPKEFVDDIALRFKGLKQVLDLSNDGFIRTTDQAAHWPSVQKVWLKLKERGDIYKKNYRGLYCSGCEAFITKKDLVQGKCAIHLKEPELINEENYFFKLSRYADKIKDLIEKDKLKIVPEARKNEMLSFINQGLEDVSFSRPRKDLKWGIPVPGDDSQTIYVWADALTNYISAIGYEKENKVFKKFWPADIHCVGKDILKFHALIWPGMLLSLGLDLPKSIFVHGFITVDGQKMSKSLGNVIDPFELAEKYGRDPVRYYLLREIPSSEDGDFSYEKFEKRYNSELASGIGNLVSRVRVMAEKAGFKEKKSKAVNLEIERTSKNYSSSIKSLKFNEALKAVWELIGFCDKHIEENRPWEEKEDSSEVLGSLLVVLDNIAGLLKPFLPETAEKIEKEIERDKKSGRFKNKREGSLFPKILPKP
jgi:methionyl-tRNA synthetase